MGVRRVEIPRAVNTWPTYSAWIEWVKRMGLDPNLVCVPGYVEVDDEARTVTAVCHVRTEDGRGICAAESGESAKRVDVTVQLESRALPLPQVFA